MTRRSRHLHPGAWWLWALTLAVAAGRTENPVLLLLVVAVTGYVVASRRPQTPWSHSYVTFLKLGLLAVAIRVVLMAALGGDAAGHVLVRLPEIPLPHWMAGVRLGGPLTEQGLVGSAEDGLRLAVILCCVGAANALTSPRRLLKALPSALYETGVAVTVAVAFAPQAVASARRLHAARRLRRHRGGAMRGWRGVIVPVLDGALERSVDLAAAMEVRGFGRRDGQTPAVRRAIAVTTLTGLVTLVASSYGLLASGAPALLGWPAFAAGVAFVAVGFALGLRAGGRTRHRPDRWQPTEWLVSGCGLAAAVAVAVTPASVLTPDPATWPPLAVVPFVGILVAVLPAGLAPPLPRARAARPSAPRSVPTRPERVPA